MPSGRLIVNPSASLRLTIAFRSPGEGPTEASVELGDDVPVETVKLLVQLLRQGGDVPLDLGPELLDGLRDAGVFVTAENAPAGMPRFECALDGRASTSPEPLELRFSRNRSAFTGAEEPKVILLAYGATRLLPRAGEQATPPTSAWARVRNLFDPFSPIGNSTDWLLSLDDATFEEIARALKGLLDLETGDRLVRNRRGRRVDVEAFGLRVPLEHLSDGYQSVVALATDLMISLLQQWPTVDAAEGTVLIDELGAHLHPRWRMRIVPSLRQVFPRVQFLTSTHDPLCLRGLGDGEVVVVKRDADGEVVAVTDLPSVAGLRVDQLLTSEHFGLNSTIDPELDALFAEYYLLKAKPHRTAADTRRLGELQVQLDGLDVLGSTRRERIVLEAADDYLAKAGTLADPTERLELKESTKKRIAAIWEKASAGRAVR